jgi:hypothetical protein
VEVEEDEIRAGFGDDLNRTIAIRCFADDLMPEVLDADFPQHFAKHQVIFNDNNPHGVMEVAEVAAW